MKSRALLVAWLALAAPTTHAVIIAGTDGTTNTTAPGNGAPWDYVGTIGGATGVLLGDYDGGYWVITANHVGLGDFLLNGVTYTAVGGSGVQIGGADLFVFQISSSPLLPNLALSATAPSTGASVTMIGNGLNRDAPKLFWSVNTNGNPSGDPSGNAWIWTPLPNATGANASGYDWGSGNTLRVNGRAQVSADPDLLASFRIEGKAPRTVIVMTVEEIYFQCARAIVRSDLWNPDKRVDPKTLPTPGQILADMSENRVGGEDYDKAWPERARQSLW